MNRKEFIQKTVGASIGCAFLGLSGCVGTYYAKHEKQGKKIVVNLTEFWDEKRQKNRDFVIIREESLEFPVYLWKNQNEYIALYMYCPHKGCELNAQNDFLICPCHGSEFDKMGKVQNPPADKDLLRFTTHFDETQVYILLD